MEQRKTKAGRGTLTRAILSLVVLCVIGWTGLSAQNVRAQCGTQPPVQNFTGAGTVACPCFIPGEQAGVVLDVPPSMYPIEILKVGIGWGSQFGGNPAQIEQAIHIYQGGLPSPGTPIFTLLGPQLNDGVINEFNLEPIPGEIIVNSGPFTVTLEFLNQSAGNFFAPSVVHDGNGCQPGKNVVLANPGGWNDACLLGVTGDWVFYAIYRKAERTIAAASPDGLGSAPFNQTTCDTIFIVNSGCSTLNIQGISGCDVAPFSIDTTGTSHAVAGGDTTTMQVCITPTGAGPYNCTVSIVSDADNGTLMIPVGPSTVTAIQPPEVRGTYEILSVSPNPFNPSTVVRFSIPERMAVTADVWTVDGQRVRNLAKEQMFAAGDNWLRWDGSNSRSEPLGSGVYFIRISTRLGDKTTRAVLLK